MRIIRAPETESGQTSRMAGRTSWKWLVFCAAVGIALLLVVGPAAADTVDVVVDDSPVDLTAKDDGTHEAKVGITNVSDAVVRFAPETVNDDPGCVITPKHTSVDPATQTSVTLNFSTGCNTDTGIDFVLSFEDDATPSTIELEANPADDEPSPDWNILWKAAAGAAIPVIVILLWVLASIEQMNEDNEGPKATKQRDRVWYSELIRQLDVAYVSGVSPSEPPELSDAPRITWGANLPGLGTNWAFKDSWASNITLVTAALLGVIAASDVLKPVLGDETDAVVALFAVVAGIAAVLVALGPLILKAFGSDVGIPTVGGTITAATVVIAGSLFQITALVLQADRLVGPTWVSTLIFAGGTIIVVVVALYAIRSVRGLIAGNLVKPPREISNEERAGWIVYAALRRPSGPNLPITPVDIVEVLAAADEVGPAGTSKGDEPRTALI